MQIAPHVHIIEHVRGGNVYLLVDSMLALIDTGMPGNLRAVFSYIRWIGREPSELAHIFVTHGHVDHAGSAGELRRATGAAVVAHRLEVDDTCRGHVLVPGRRRNSPILRVVSRLMRFEPAEADILVSGGETFPYVGGLRVVHTPGHTPGSVSLLLETEGVLFVGDAVINNGDRLSRPIPFGADAAESERSLRQLLQLPFGVCCFGHGPVLMIGAREALADLAANYPTTPLWRRLLRRRRHLARFGRRLWRKPPGSSV